MQCYNTKLRTTFAQSSHNNGNMGVRVKRRQMTMECPQNRDKCPRKSAHDCSYFNIGLLHLWACMPLSSNIQSNPQNVIQYTVAPARLKNWGGKMQGAPGICSPGKILKTHTFQNAIFFIYRSPLRPLLDQDSTIHICCRYCTGTYYPPICFTK